MTDIFDKDSRSRVMRSIRSKNTRPEILLRQTLRNLGYPGYRLHRKDLPGKPDCAFIGRKLAIFLHGCFWHGHNCKRGRRRPETNAEYWRKKIASNRRRDASALAQLKLLGWRTIVVWECELPEIKKLSKKLTAGLHSRSRSF
jgi:DNA mismatch endonuclease (patch repair protein)